MSQPSNMFGLLATISLPLLDYRRQEICIAAETMYRAALVCSHYHALAERLPSSGPTLLQPSPFISPPSQDPFKYSYPPLPDDDFQTPICDNGPIVSEDEVESKDGESEVKDALESSFGSEVAVKPKKVRSLSGLSQVVQINLIVEPDKHVGLTGPLLASSGSCWLDVERMKESHESQNLKPLFRD